MKKLITFLLAFTIVLTVPAQQRVQTPAEIYGALFTDVQMSGIFPDSKTFPDCTPKRDPNAIVKDYLAIKNNPAIKFNLEGFVKENFDLPKTPQLNYITREKDVVMHIKNLWNVLRREKDVAVAGSSLLPLPNPYIVPGGRFREIYYWDSYFTMLGLKESGEVDMMENMVKNFSYLINTYGHIPNGNRSYYISRSQPPYFSMMVDLLASIKGDEVYKMYLPALEKEYQFWMQGSSNLKPGQTYRRVVKLKDGTVLNRYWDDAATPRPEGFKEDVDVAKRSGRNIQTMYRNLRAGAESGVDFSSRWFADKKNLITIQVTDIIPVDLNCLLYNLESVLENAYRITHQENKRKKFNTLAYKREQKMRKLFYSDSLHFFSDYNFVKGRTTDMPCATSLFLLKYIREPNPEGIHTWGQQGAAFVKKYLLRDGGIVTTPNNTGQQWDAPNGWAPLQWIVIMALERCHQQDLAKDIAYRWIKLNNDVFLRTGRLMEKYNVVDTHLEAGGGEYPGQDGFGWTNGVLLALIKKYGMHD